MSGEQPPLSLSSADEGSWTQVEDYEAKPTLWVPDHAATNCAKCNTQFWIANRKHHCRYSERRHFDITAKCTSQSRLECLPLGFQFPIFACPSTLCFVLTTMTWPALVLEAWFNSANQRVETYKFPYFLTNG